jgi:sporulation protein YabP
MTSAEQHDINMKGRKFVEVTGVSSVESFDVTEFSLITSGGPLRIEGTNLHMKHLDLEQGVVVIEGTLSSMAYVSETAKKKKFTRKLFR